MEYAAGIQNYIDLEISVLRRMDCKAIGLLMGAIDDARRRDATIYIMGNGGSAATASHFANDFNKGLSEHMNEKFRFICLNDNLATVMALANDCGYDHIFEYQLRGRVKQGDLVIGISGSGNSKNVLLAITYAKSAGAITAGLTGYDGGRLKTLADISVHVPVMSMQVTEDIHMVINHLMMAVFYRELCGIDHAAGGVG